MIGEDESDHKWFRGEHISVDVDREHIMFATKANEAEPMNLQMTLKLAGLNRNTFNTIERRSGLPFMKRNLLNAKGHDRYTLVHATALACMLEFQAAGLDLARACSATDDFFDVIDGIVFGGISEGKADANTAWLTIINFASGDWGWASGEENADTFGGGTVTSKVSVNVVGVWEKLTARFGTENDAMPEVEEGAS